MTIKDILISFINDSPDMNLLHELEEKYPRLKEHEQNSCALLQCIYDIYECEREDQWDEVLFNRVRDSLARYRKIEELNQILLNYTDGDLTLDQYIELMQNVKINDEISKEIAEIIVRIQDMTNMEIIDRHYGLLLKLPGIIPQEIIVRVSAYHLILHEY